MDYLQSADYLEKIIQHIKWRESLSRGGLEFSISKAVENALKSPVLGSNEKQFSLERDQ